MESVGLIKSNSLMVIGQKTLTTDRIRFDSLFDATGKTKEEELRDLLSQISQHVKKAYIRSGSARKFLNGKLLFYERPSSEEGINEIYCLFTEEQNISNDHKKAFKAIVSRGGIYSSRRFFSEMIELIQDDDKLNEQSDFSIPEAISTIENYGKENIGINTLGRVISFLSHSGAIESAMLETIYLIVYETIQVLENDPTEDPDEFLDAAFLIANLYETRTFHLSLELYKKIIPLAAENKRYNLEAASLLRSCSIYKDKFPDSGEIMLKQLLTITNRDKNDITKRNLETYYVFMGHAYYELQNYEKAKINFEKAVETGSNNISSPLRIAEAYSSLAAMSFQEYYFKESSRQYLTASTLAFSTGNIALADSYLHQAALPDIYASLALAMTALNFRMEGEFIDAEFKSWEAMRMLIKAYIHSMAGDTFMLMETTDRVLSYVSSILNIPGKKRKNGKIIRAVRKLIDDLTWNRIDQGQEERRITKVMNDIDRNVPMPPPVFMLLSNDGRLIMMGEVSNEGWIEPDLKGVILSGIISAITSLISEVGEKKSSLKNIDAGNFQIMIEQGEHVLTVLLVDRVNTVFRTKLIEVNDYIEDQYQDVLKSWDGYMDYFNPLIELVQEIFTPNKITRLL